MKLLLFAAALGIVWIWLDRADDSVDTDVPLSFAYIDDTPADYTFWGIEP